jgi:E3 ubiquitin-protein ligase SspH2
LPEDIIYAPRRADISVEDNLFSQQVLIHLQTSMNAAGYRGPRIYFSMATEYQNQSNQTLPRLDHVVAMWHENTCPMPAAQQQLWQQIAQEADAHAFACFLERLHDTVNYHPEFKLLVIEWLHHLAQHPQLRAQTFAISIDASASCEDRVSLSFNQMKHARLAYDIDNGKYDNQIATVIDLARGMFRLDALEKIARIKAASLHFIDEIEVYLAYQVKLRDALELPLDIGEMRFFDVSDVTEEDLADATKKIWEWEKTEFSDYLASAWSPWQALLKRCDPEGYADNQRERQQVIESIDTTAFSDQVKVQMQLFQDLDPQAQQDAENGIIKEICDARLKEINRAWTQSFLMKNQLYLSSN